MTGARRLIRGHVRWIATAALVLAVPLYALAQGTPPASGDLELKTQKKKTVVAPKPGAAQAVKDADAVKRKLDTGAAAAAKDMRPAHPGLDPDVTGGIQSKNIKRELKK